MIRVVEEIKNAKNADLEPDKRSVSGLKSCVGAFVKKTKGQPAGNYTVFLTVSNKKDTDS